MHAGSRDLAAPTPTHAGERSETGLHRRGGDELQPFTLETMWHLVERIRANKVALKARWHALCQSQLGAHPLFTEKLLQETYVPRLRSAMEAVLRSDTLAFFSAAR